MNINKKQTILEQKAFDVFFPDKETDEPELLKNVENFIDNENNPIHQLQFKQFPKHPINLALYFNWNHIVNYFLYGVEKFNKEDKKNIIENDEFLTLLVLQNNYEIFDKIIILGADIHKKINNKYLLELALDNDEYDFAQHIIKLGFDLSKNNYEIFDSLKDQNKKIDFLINHLDSHDIPKISNIKKTNIVQNKIFKDFVRYNKDYILKTVNCSERKKMLH